MDKLEELVQAHCPQGAKYVLLESVCQISKGIQFNKSDMNDSGTYPVINGGITASGYIEQYNQEENTITISQGGASAGYVNWIETKFWAGAHCYVLKPSDKVLNRYLFHFVKSKEQKLQECQYGAGIPALAKSTVASLQIPLPPLPVQQEIVRILDSFTELTAELTAELAARRKQYEHYRDELLTFGDEVPRYSLSSICDIVDYRGKTPKKTESGIFLVTAKNIRKGYIDYEKSQEFISRDDYSEVMRRGLPQIGDVLITTEAPCGNVAQVDRENIALAQRVIKYRPKNELLDSTYLKYILLGKDFQSKLDVASTGGTVKGIKGSRLHALTIPVPSIEKQKQIVSILSRFEVLCSDLTSGLPAEIAARQKQYEYYRDKLLTFKEKME